MKCDSCSADISPDMLHCLFCGSYVERGTSNSDPHKESPRQEDFERIRRSPQFQAVLQGLRLRKRLLSYSRFAPAPSWVLAFVVTIGITIATANLVVMLWVFPMVLAICSGYMVLLTGLKKDSVAQPPATPVPAIVVTKRVEMRGENRDLPSYFALFRFESGLSNELRIWDPKQFEQLSAADPGYLISRTKSIVEFRPVKI